MEEQKAKAARDECAEKGGRRERVQVKVSLEELSVTFGQSRGHRRRRCFVRARVGGGIGVIHRVGSVRGGVSLRELALVVAVDKGLKESEVGRSGYVAIERTGQPLKIATLARRAADWALGRWLL